MPSDKLHEQRQDAADFVNWTIEVGRLSERFLGLSYEELERDHCANDFYEEGSWDPIQYIKTVVMDNIAADFGPDVIDEAIFENLFYR